MDCYHWSKITTTVPQACACSNLFLISEFYSSVTSEYEPKTANVGRAISLFVKLNGLTYLVTYYIFSAIVISEGRKVANITLEKRS